MTRQEIIDFCLTFPAAYEDYPFDDITDPGKWTVMRHKTNKKSFALIYERNGKLCVNLKCDPFEADFLRQLFADVTPGYHMNKTHWNTVMLGGDVSDDDLKQMIEQSYDLIKPKGRNAETMTDTLENMIEGANSNNLFMQCDTPNEDAFRPLPQGFTARHCRRDEIIVWKEMWAQGKYMDFVNYYYDAVYASQEKEFLSRCIFAADASDRPVATSGIWRSYGRINTVLGFFVSPEYEGLGIGRGLFSNVMRNAEYPVYVHTHPIAHRAVKLYSDFGFRFITDPVIGYRKNDLNKSLPYLREVLPENFYAGLQFTKANEELLTAAITREMAEF